jgi:hypothetical protein
LKSPLGKSFHILFQLTGLGSITVGLIAIIKEINNQREAHFTSIHSWLGIMTASLFFHNIMVAVFRELVKNSSYIIKNFPNLIEQILTYHRIIGTATLISTCITIVSGVLFGQGDCSVPTSYRTLASRYQNFSFGCKISNGLINFAFKKDIILTFIFC